MNTLRREIEIMKELNHPNIVKFHDVYEDNTHLHIVMERCTGGELFDKIIQKGRYSEKDAAVVIRQVLGAVAYLHNKQIAHRDLKPENFLFAWSDKRSETKGPSPLKLIDFGLSRFITDSFMKTRVGTPYYIAPVRKNE